MYKNSKPSSTNTIVIFHRGFFTIGKVILKLNFVHLIIDIKLSIPNYTNVSKLYSRGL